MEAILATIILLLSSFCRCDDSPAQPATESKFFGMFITEAVPTVGSQMVGQCFYGLGQDNCQIQNLDSLELLENNINYTLSLQDPKNPTRQYQTYCLLWPYIVSYAFASTVEWKISCEPIFANDINVYGFEVRFLAQRWDGDLGVVSCPLKREGCTYDSSGSMIGCDNALTKYLHGYNLTINVKFQTDGEDQWRGVQSCEANALEGNSPPDSLTEHIYLVNVTDVVSYSPTAIAVVVVVFLCLVTVLALLRFYRTDVCKVCFRRLWIARNRCFFCYFVKARTPPASLMYMISTRQDHDKSWHKGPPDEWVEEMKERRDHPLTARTKAAKELISAGQKPIIRQASNILTLQRSLSPKSMLPKRQKIAVEPVPAPSSIGNSQEHPPSDRSVRTSAERGQVAPEDLSPNPSRIKRRPELGQTKPIPPRHIHKKKLSQHHSMNYAEKKRVELC